MLSSEHLILGWALALRSFASAHSSEDDYILEGRIQEFLEPAASNDSKARAVHVATVLELMSVDDDPVKSRKIRVALMCLWAIHHNSVVRAEDLQFFISSDFAAYLATVEKLFEDYLPGQLETTVIHPLAKMWRDGTENVESLRKMISRWLVFIFPGDESGSSEKNERPSKTFVSAKTIKQLRLSYAAISIVSFRPELSLLPDLADCYRSTDFCFADFNDGKDSRRLPTKNPIESLGILARWHYGIQGFQQIGRLASKLDPESADWDSLRWFSRQWRRVLLPGNFGYDDDVIIHNPKNLTEAFSEFQIYLKNEMAKERRYIGLGYIDSLAIRRDLPALSSAEIDALVVDVKTRLTAVSGYKKMSGTLEEKTFDDLLPWLARYAPQEFAIVVRKLWLFAIKSDEVLQRLMHLKELLPADFQDGDLVDEILCRTPHILAQEQPGFVVVTLSEAILLHGTSAQLMNWFENIEKCGIRDSLVVSILPLPIAFECFAPTDFAALVESQMRSAIATLRDTDFTESNMYHARYWLQIYTYLADVTTAVARWALELFEGHPGDGVNHSLFRIVMKSNDSLILRTALHSKQFRRFQLGADSLLWGANIPETEFPSFTFLELKDIASSTVCGWLLYRGKQDTELAIWGRDLSQRALKAISTSSSVPKTKIKLNRDRDGRNLGWSYIGLPGGHKIQYSTASAVWGVNREENTPTPSAEEYQQNFEDFVAEINERKQSDRAEFIGFNAMEPFIRWSELDPQKFTLFAESYLTAARRAEPGTIVDLDFFTSVVTRALFRVNPESALALHEWRSGNSLTQVLSFDDPSSWSTSILWKLEYNGDETIEMMRRNILLQARHDEALLWHVIAAEIADNDKALDLMVAEWVGSEKDSERALAVSLLAFRGTANALQQLASLQNDDPSYWVRDHAVWAWEVAILELSCIKRYREILTAKSLQEVAAGLEEIRPALSPKSRSWQWRTEREFPEFPNDKRISGYISIFWYHWRATNTHRVNVEVGHRKLQEYCRGQKLSNGVTDKMAPWWSVD